VLIVADDDQDSAPLKRALATGRGCDVVGPLSVLEALRFCGRGIPPAVLVDLRLQDISAAEFCTLIRGRANGTRASILFFGSPRGRRGTTVAMVPKADGYISDKDLGTVADRIQSLIRPSPQSNGDALVREYRGRHLEAHFDRVEITVDGERVDLARRELALLQFLVTHPNRILKRADILGHVWRNENDGRSRTVDVHIRRLRMKLGAAGEQIQTVQSVGYRFDE
jgi:DNA-binding response OmpR family regulator